MNRVEHLLTQLGEECAEVAQRSSKAARFGLLEVQDAPENVGHLNNSERIIVEYADILAVVEMLADEGHLVINHETLALLKKAKKEKIEKYLLYAAKVGTLTEPPPPPKCRRCDAEGVELLEFGLCSECVA